MLELIGTGAIYEDVKEDEIVAKVIIYDLVKGEHEVKRSGDAPQSSDPVSITDMSGNKILAKADNVQYVDARFLNSGSYVVTTPAMSQGEQVEVYRAHRTDRYYFKLLHSDKDLRHKERVVIAVSNTTKDNPADHGKHFDKDTSYTFTIDTNGKLVELNTSVSDGEPVLFTIGVDTKKGVFSIEDGNKQFFRWDAVNGVLDIDMPTINLNGKKMTFTAEDSITTSTNKMDVSAKKIKVKANSTIMDTKVTFKKMVEFMAITSFKALADFKSAVKMNGNAKTTDGASVL